MAGEKIRKPDEVDVDSFAAFMAWAYPEMATRPSRANKGRDDDHYFVVWLSEDPVPREAQMRRRYNDFMTEVGDGPQRRRRREAVSYALGAYETRLVERLMSGVNRDMTPQEARTVIDANIATLLP